MYIRACSVSYTNTFNEFPKGKKEFEKYCRVLRSTGRKLFLYTITRLPARQPVVPSTGVSPIASHIVVHSHQCSKYLTKAFLQDQRIMSLFSYCTTMAGVLHDHAVTSSTIFLRLPTTSMLSDYKTF